MDAQPFEDVDALRGRGGINWEQYAKMMKDALAEAPGAAAGDAASGVRDSEFRLLSLREVLPFSGSVPSTNE